MAKLSVFLGFSIIFGWTTGEIQHVRFYEASSTCNSLPIATIYESTNNVNSSTFASMSLQGMWQIWSCPSPNFNCGSPVSTYIVNCSPTPFCIGRAASVLYNFRMVGDSYQRSPEIHLYSSREFAGQVVKVTRSTSWSHAPLVHPSSPIPSSEFSVASFWFTGTHEWSLFSETDFKGSKICLKPTGQVFAQGFGFTGNKALSNAYVIKSARYGCNGGLGLRHEFAYLVLCFLYACLVSNYL
ncbi:uncharacterized protein LOC110863221 [Folsomia candida]|uniref:Uncharacterized protein n=1 Tax=Folsomia candida TaxID=158441 RepID=A0A226F706_FOLCA|nr:uncharacterized protein LOC110863221 [Folsomia candida]OXA65228.1 hypothetical protein Fcan01_02946 [Folsomia candida]